MVSRSDLGNGLGFANGGGIGSGIERGEGREGIWPRVAKFWLGAICGDGVAGAREGEAALA
jgi:hypothetical protein